MLFRKAINQLAGRLKSVTASGAEFAGIGNQLEKANPRPEQGTLRELPGVERTQAVADLELQIHQNLANYPEDRKKDLLVRELAQARIDAVFGVAYSNIFGSQIALLKRLRENGGKATIDDVGTYFDQVRERLEVFKDTSLNMYLRFLENHSLIVVDENMVNLTSLGHDFLLYLYRFNLSDERAL